MKRVLLHIAFWLLYSVQDVLLVFLVNITRTQQTTGITLLFSVEHVMLLLIPKLLFTYFILSITLNRIIKEGFGRKWTWYSLFALLLTIVLYRALLALVVNPLIYGWHDESASFFYALGFPVALMDIGFVSGVAIAIKQIRQQLQRAKKEQLLMKEKLETELKFLRNQTNPHFLFNTLNNIYTLALMKDENAPDSIMKLSNIMRYVTDDATKDFLSLQDEINCINDYIELQRLRIGEKPTIDLDISEDIGNVQIAPLILMTFIENVFKYGISKHNKSVIVIKIKSNETGIYFFCQNKIFPEKEENKRAGIGLINTRQRLAHLYPGKHILNINTENELYTVELTLHTK